VIRNVGRKILPYAAGAAGAIVSGAGKEAGKALYKYWTAPRRRPLLRGPFSRTGGPPTGTFVKPIKTRFWKGKKSKKMRALYKYAALPRVWQSVGGTQAHGLHGQQRVWEVSGLDVAAIDTLRNCVLNNDANAMALADDQIYIRSHSRKFEMTNHSNGLITVKIYTFVARHDRLDGLTDSLEAIWRTGLDAQIGVNSNSSYMDIGQEPLSVPTVGQYWRLVKKQQVKMMPGGVHTHFSSERIGKWFSQHRFSADNANRTTNKGIIGGVTSFTLFVMHGQPASPDQALTPDKVTTLQGSLDIIDTNRFTYHYLNSRDWRICGDYYNNLDLNPEDPLEVPTNVDMEAEHMD
jgi:hypothetical protein